MSRIGLASLAAVAVAASAGAAATPPAGSWLAPVALSPATRNATAALVGADDAGDTILLWVDNDRVLLARIRRAGRRFGPPQRLATGDFIHFVNPVRLAVNARGDAVAIWTLAKGGVSHLEAAFRPAGGRFGSAEEVAPPLPNTTYATADVGLDGRADATAVWTANTSTTSEVFAARRPYGGRFGAAQALGAGVSPAVGVSAAGEAVATWLSGSFFKEVVQAAFRPAATTRFGSVQDVSTAGDTPPCCVALATNARGDAVVVWPVYIGSAETLHAAIRPAGGRFGPEEAVDGLASTGFSLAVDARGGVTVAWLIDDFVVFPLEATYRPPHGTFAPPRELSPDAGYVSLVSGRSGSTVIVWSRFAGDYVVQAARMRAGALGAARDLSKPGYNAIGTAVAADGAGDAVAVWLRSSGGTFFVQEAAYDGAGPRLAALSVPARARVGERLQLSVAPLDVWSRVDSTRWSFGDGGRASGRRVVHAYRRPGRYLVRVTSADALGHRTTAARTIVTGSRS
jgi:hypothetical protein